MRNKKKKIVILGATGSIGLNAIDIIEKNPNLFKIVGLVANSNFKKMEELSRKFLPEKIAFYNKNINKKIKLENFNKNVHISFGEEGIISIAQMDADLVINGIAGFAGLKPTMASIEVGRKIAIANKEPLVSAGNLIMENAKKNGAIILPVDSEHNAIFQIISKFKTEEISEVTLTASGGPFREDSLDLLSLRTPEEAVIHPKWSMGPKISVDSSTMMNKALEVIEASVLFNLPSKKIKVLVHPESIVHGMVSTIDGNLIACMAVPDMRIPLLNVMTWPDREKNSFRPPILNQLNFYNVNKNFPSIKLARLAMNKGFIATTMLNAANEIAVDEFLNHRIKFCDIFAIIRAIVKIAKKGNPKSIKEVFDNDLLGRNLAKKYIKNMV